MVLFNRIDLAPLHGSGLDVAFRAAEDLASRVAGGLAAGSPLSAMNGLQMTEAKLEPTDEGALLTLIVPGFGPDDLDISIKREVVTVTGERGADPENKHTFRRVFKTPFPIDADAAVATVEHGILELRLPRHESETPKSVRIEGKSAAPKTLDTPSSGGSDGPKD